MESYQNNNTKTVFITVGRGFVARNILRSGVLEHLKKRNARVVIFLNDIHGNELPESFRKEFEDEQVSVEIVSPPRLGRLQRRFERYTSLLVYNYHNRKVRYLRSGTSQVLLWCEWFMLAPLSHLHILKHLVRFFEQRLFENRNYATYFDRYRPDIILSTSAISSFDVAFMKEAKRRSVKTVSMPRGWDNIISVLYKVIPDVLVVYNNDMKRDAIRYQRIPEERIRVCGLPQFDWYRKEGVIVSREAYCKSIGLDPARKIIVWGSTGIWTPDDNNIAETLADVVSKDNLALPASLLVRPYPMEAKTKRLEHLNRWDNVFVDTNFTLSDFFRDHTDPSVAEIKQFVNTMYHADAVVTLCSTLSLDALCVDRPVINTVFKGFYDKSGRDISYMLYLHDHYRPLFKLGAIALTCDERELIDAINEALLHPERRKEERKAGLEALCYTVDGNASKRIADAVLE